MERVEREEIRGKKIRSWVEDGGGKRLERKRCKEKEREIDGDGVLRIDQRKERV